MAGQPKRFLGIGFLYNSDGSIHLDQAEYVESVLRKFHMSDVKGVRKPMEQGVVVPKNYGEVTNKPFRSLLGALSYLSINTRPDIAFAVNELARQRSLPSDIHWGMAKKILRYVAGTGHEHMVYFSHEEILVLKYFRTRASCPRRTEKVHLVRIFRIKEIRSTGKHEHRL